MSAKKPLDLLTYRHNDRTMLSKAQVANQVAQWKSAHQVAPGHNLVTPYSIQSAYAVCSRKAIGGNTTSSPQFGHFALEGPCAPRYKISILCSQYGQSRATLVPKAAMLNWIFSSSCSAFTCAYRSGFCVLTSSLASSENLSICFITANID